MSESADAFGMVGTVLKDHLQIQGVVGAGGFGTVYRAYHTKLASPVAVKCLRIPDFLDAAGRSRFVEKFIAEGRLMYELSRADAGIVKSIEVDVFSMPNGVPVPYLVLEWVDGQPLEALIEANMREGRRAPIEEVIERLDPVARALCAAHDGNVAHRDIKPSNIMLTQVLGRQTAKILDFGIAKIVQETGGGAHTTRDQGESSFGFTPCYAAPEQWVARYGATGPWTDVFAFALVCVEYLTAQMGLPGDTIPHWMGASMDVTQRPTPRARGVDLGDAVESVFQKALAVNPQERYRHMSTFWSELKNAASMRTSRSSMADAAMGNASTQYAPHSSGNVVVRPPSGGDAPPGGQGTVPGGYLPPPTPPPPPAGPMGFAALAPGPLGGPQMGSPMGGPPMGGPPMGGPMGGPPMGGPMGGPPMGGPPMGGPMGGPPGPGNAWGPHPGGVTSTGGMAMMPMGMGGYPMQPPAQEKSGLSPVVLGSILAFLLVVLGVMVVVTIRIMADQEGPVATATGTLPSLGAPTRPRTADEVIGSLDPTKPADAPGALSIFCVPACDVVLVDGKPVGASPVVSSSLRPGRHVVAVSRMGAAPQQTDVFVPAGGSVAQRFWLDP